VPFFFNGGGRRGSCSIPVYVFLLAVSIFCEFDHVPVFVKKGNHERNAVVNQLLNSSNVSADTGSGTV
jgi:hypothetical protein